MPLSPQRAYHLQGYKYKEMMTQNKINFLIDVHEVILENKATS